MGHRYPDPITLRYVKLKERNITMLNLFRILYVRYQFFFLLLYLSSFTVLLNYILMYLLSPYISFLQRTVIPKKWLHCHQGDIYPQFQNQCDRWFTGELLRASYTIWSLLSLNTLSSFFNCMHCVTALRILSLFTDHGFLHPASSLS